MTTLDSTLDNTSLDSASAAQTHNPANNIPLTSDSTDTVKADKKADALKTPAQDLRS